jgi:hypothetical protein
MRGVSALFFDFLAEPNTYCLKGNVSALLSHARPQPVTKIFINILPPTAMARGMQKDLREHKHMHPPHLPVQVTHHF